jgi:hypothetical protein
LWQKLSLLKAWPTERSLAPPLLNPACETVGGIDTTRIADSLVHVEDKSLGQELELVAAEVGGLGIVVAEWSQCLEQD